MENININKILNRETTVATIIDILKEFELNKNNILTKKGIYIYGDPGTGKTTFITNILKELNYDNIVIINFNNDSKLNNYIIELLDEFNINIMHKSIFSDRETRSILEEDERIQCWFEEYY